MGKVKKKCCRSTPRCKKCPVTVLLKARDKAREKALRKALKQDKKSKKERKREKKAA